MEALGMATDDWQLALSRAFLPCLFRRCRTFFAHLHCALALSFDGALWSFLLAFHLRQALFEGGHQIDHLRGLLGFLNFSDFFAFEVCLNELLEVFLEGVVV